LVLGVNQLQTLFIFKMTTFELKFDKTHFQKRITDSREILHKTLKEEINTLWKGFFAVLILAFCIVSVPQAVSIILSWLSIIAYFLYIGLQYLKFWKERERFEKIWGEWITENELVKKHILEFDDEVMFYYRDDETIPIKWKDVVYAQHTKESITIQYEVLSIANSITIPFVALDKEIGVLLSKTVKLNTRHNFVED
jgi:hypothetical protein